MRISIPKAYFDNKVPYYSFLLLFIIVISNSLHYILLELKMKRMYMELKLYSVSDLSGILKLHPKTIIRFIKEDKIKARKIGRSWMVSEEELKNYCHAELSGNQLPPIPSVNESDADKINASVVVEMNDQDPEKVSRLSNSLMAMLNSEKGQSGGTRYDFIYYPEIQKVKYTFYGDPGFISKILTIFDELNRTKGQ